MIISITFTPNERREADCVYHFARAYSPNSTFWFTPVSAQQYEAALLAIRKTLEAPSDTPELLLEVAKGLVGLT